MRQIAPMEPYKPDPILASLFEKIKMLRGTPEQWLERSILVTRYIGEVPDHQRVFCRGEVHIADHHYPAVLIYDTKTCKVLAYAPSGDTNAMLEYGVGYFHSGIPHAAMCKEVNDPTNRSLTI